MWCCISQLNPNRRGLLKIVRLERKLGAIDKKAIKARPCGRTDAKNYFDYL
tara:strand:+ start:8671 stop:8823 length:153 start_codon:yes stop_codon:yes gene_type:complete